MRRERDTDPISIAGRRKVMSGEQVNNDSEELQRLFDSVAEEARQRGSQPLAGPVAQPDGGTAELISRVGQLTRALHDNLRELGYDKLLEKAAAAIPDTRDRLAYISVMTEQAAVRVLNAAELAKPIQDDLARDAGEIALVWQRLEERKLNPGDLRQLVQRTRRYLDEVPEKAGVTNEQLTEIIMAQDFQDLTGQVIKKITDMVRGLEQDMVKLLLDYVPADKRVAATAGLMNGPAIRSDGYADVVTSQNQVDELLESLGF